MYKKLFTINYNNKKFVIFVDQNHYKTFLEEKNNKLYYPLLEDYLFLNNIYNQKQDIIMDIKKFSFIPKVINKKRLISLIMAFELGLIPTDNYNANITNYLSNNENTNYEEIIYNEPYSYEKSLEALDAYFNHERILKDDVVNAIDNNPNLSDYDKNICKIVLDDMLKLDPNMNLRIFYENIKDLIIIRVSPVEIKNEAGKNVRGYYRQSGNMIKVTNDVTDFTLAHEIAHVAHNLCRKYDGKLYEISENNYGFLAEAFTNKIASISFGKATSYPEEGQLLDYLLYFIPNVNFKEYNKYGAEIISKEIKKLYPSVDIDYILDYYQTYTTTSLYLDNDELLSLKDINLLNELFKLCTSKIDINNTRKPFDKFSILVSFDQEIINIFLPEYNRIILSYLKENSIISNEEYNLISNIKRLVAVKGNIYILNSDNTYTDSNNNKCNIDNTSIILPTNNYFKLQIIDFTAKKIEWNNSNVLYNLLKATNNNNEAIDHAIELSKENTNSNIKEMLNDNSFYQKYKDLIKFCEDNNANYYDRFCQILIDNNIINTNQIAIINNIKYFTIYNNKIYFANNTNSYYDENNNLIITDDKLLLIPIDNHFRIDLIEGIITGKKINNDNFLNNVILNNILYNKEAKAYLKTLPLDYLKEFSNKLLQIIAFNYNNKLNPSKENYLNYIKEISNYQIDTEAFDLIFKYLMYIQDGELDFADTIDISNAQKLVIINNNIYFSYSDNTYLDYYYNTVDLNDNYITLPFNYFQKEQLISRIINLKKDINTQDNLNGFITYYINDNLPEYLESLTFEEQKVIINMIIAGLLTDIEFEKEYQILTDKLKMIIYLKCNVDIAEYFKEVGLILDTNPPTFKYEAKNQKY